MTIRDQEEKLFAEWDKQREYGSAFVKDGVVNEDAYKASKRKVAFVLKEYGCAKNKNHDLRTGGAELINTFGLGWRKVAEVLRGINVLYNPSANNDGVPDKMPDNICALNVKKKALSTGEDDAPWEVIYEFAMRDREFLKRQFEIYDPDLILCMGYAMSHGEKSDMIEIFRKVMGHEQIDKKHTVEVVTPNGGWGWYQTPSGKVVVNTYHMSDWAHEQPADKILDLIKEVDETINYSPS